MNIKSPSPWHQWIWIFLATLLIAAKTYQTSLDAYWRLPPKPLGDGIDYENMAWNLAHGKGVAFDWTSEEWRSAYHAHDQDGRYALFLNRNTPYHLTTSRPPLYPLWISTIYRITGHGPLSWMLVRTSNASFLALSILLAGWMVYRWTLTRWEDHRLAWLGAAFTMALGMLDKTTSSYAADFLTEPMAMLLTQLLVILAWSQFPRRPLLKHLSLGVCIGLMVYCRSLFVFYIPFIALIIGLPPSESSSTTGRLQSMVTVLIVALLLLSPWWVRNSTILDRWMPLGTQGPITLLGGYCDEALKAGGEWQGSADLALRAELKQDPEFEKLAPNSQELIVADEANRRVRLWIADHRSDLPYLAVARAYQLWSPFTGKSLIWKILMILGCLVLIHQRSREGLWLVGLPLITTIIVMGLYSTGSRFLVPCFGLLYALAGIGVVGAVHWTRLLGPSATETERRTQS